MVMYGYESWTKIKEVKVKVTQSCPTLCDPMDYTVHGILQARMLQWVAFPFSRASSQPRDWTQDSCIAGGFFTSWASREVKKKTEHQIIDGAGEDSWQSLGLQDQTSQSKRKSTLNTPWKDWCWSWASNTWAIWSEQSIHRKRSWRWKRLRACGEVSNRGWDGWMASWIHWTWTWANSRRWWGTEKPSVLQSWGCEESDVA